MQIQYRQRAQQCYRHQLQQLDLWFRYQHYHYYCFIIYQRKNIIRCSSRIFNRKYYFSTICSIINVFHVNDAAEPIPECSLQVTTPVMFAPPDPVIYLLFKFKLPPSSGVVSSTTLFIPALEMLLETPTQVVHCKLQVGWYLCCI